MLRLAADPDLRERLSRSGIAAMERFDRDLLAARYLRILENSADREIPGG